MSKHGLVFWLGDKEDWKEFEVSDEVFDFLTLDPMDEYSSTMHNRWKPVYDGEQTIEEANELRYHLDEFKHLLEEE